MDEVIFNIIVERGFANKILKDLQKEGINGGTISLAEGSAPSSWLDYLGLSKKEKELLTIISKVEKEDKIFSILEKDFRLKDKNTGIGYSMPLISHMDEIIEYDHMDYEYYALNIILNEGGANKCVRIANRENASGATIIKGRGAGIPERDSAFDLKPNPEKDIVIIISKKEVVNNIVRKINGVVDFSKPDTGFIFKMPIRKVIGIKGEVE